MARVLRRASVRTPTPPEGPPQSGYLGAGSAAREDERGSAVRAGRRAALAAAVLASVGALLAVGYDRLSAGQLLPRTHIGGVTVGSRSPAEAATLLEQRVVEPLRTEPITLRAHTTLRASAWEIGLRVHVDEAVRAVHDRQRSMPLLRRLWARAFGDGRRDPLDGAVDERRLQDFLAAASRRIDRPARDATVRIQGSGLSVVPHQVGRELAAAAAASHLVNALRVGDTDIRLPVAITQPALRTEAFAKVVLVNTRTNTLHLYLDREVARTYRVATGTPGHPTPLGQFRITAKRRNPTWGNPWAPWSMNMPAFIGPGPDNPLGTRALNLNVSGIRIHGTPDAASIGGPASHGCIRMLMREAEELFELVEVGTPVLIIRS